MTFVFVYSTAGITQSMGVKADQERVATLAQELVLLSEQSRAELTALEGSSQVIRKWNRMEHVF